MISSPFDLAFALRTFSNADAPLILLSFTLSVISSLFLTWPEIVAVLMMA